MKNNYSIILIICLLFSAGLQAQEKPADSTKINKLIKRQTERFQDLIEEEKSRLKDKIREVNDQLEEKEISEQKADSLKTAYAENSAEVIQSLKNIRDNRINIVERTGKLPNPRNSINIGSFDITFYEDFEEDEDSLAVEKVPSRTNSTLSLGLGYTFMDGENLGIDDFSFGHKNKYFSLGYMWETRVLQNAGWLYMRYGLEYQSLSVELNGNRHFTSDIDNTQITVGDRNYDKAKFRQDQFIAPLQFVISGYETKTTKDGRTWYQDYDYPRIGFGGYVGVNIGSRLKFKYEEDDDTVKTMVANSFDNQVLLYGLDAFIGWRGMEIFGRYALNDVFNDGSVDGNYISFGVRFIDF